MSKSLGNSPDPLELIATYGADAVRTGMLFSSPAGNDLLYDEKLIEQGRNFANKIWNAFRLVKGWSIEIIDQPQINQVAADWFTSKLNYALTELNDHFNRYRISDALLTIYKLTWDDFCSWYLEIIKPEFGKPIDTKTYEQTIAFFETVLKALHPFMPFITEELWHELKERQPSDCIIVARWPQPTASNQYLLNEAENSFSVITEIRNIRNAKGISPKEPLTLNVKKSDDLMIDRFWPVVEKLANLSSINFGVIPQEGSTSFMVKSSEFLIPLSGKIDAEKDREALQKELDYQLGFLASVNKKLDNERFVSSAPANVIENERRKKSDAEAKIKVLQENLARL
jgi:valyl-tRNA synthetase